MLGIDPVRESWLAHQVREAIDRFGTWFEQQIDATERVPVPQGQKPHMLVPRYTDDQLKLMLGMDLTKPENVGYKVGDRVFAEMDLDRTAREILRGWQFSDDDDDTEPDDAPGPLPGNDEGVGADGNAENDPDQM